MGSYDHGFLYDGSTYTTLDDPNGVGSTIAQGISGNTIVGYYTDSNNVAHGFTYTMESGSNYTITVSASPSAGGTVSGGGTFSSGSSHTVTATANSGYTFTNWTENGRVVSSAASYTFALSSNLTLQANFVETNKPTLSITAPTPGQHLTNALVTVSGTAGDTWKVAGVWYQLNGEAWSQPASTNGWTNWTTTVELQAGTNTIKAYALDLGGNFSTTNSVSFTSSNAFMLQLAFTSAQPLASNGLNFVLHISPGIKGHVQVSTDLVNWITLTGFTGTNATIDVHDPAATNFNQRFYRAVVP